MTEENIRNPAGNVPVTIEELEWFSNGTFRGITVLFYRESINFGWRGGRRGGTDEKTEDTNTTTVPWRLGSSSPAGAGLGVAEATTT